MHNGKWFDFAGNRWECAMFYRAGGGTPPLREGGRLGGFAGGWCVGGGDGENRGELFRNKRKMSELVLRLGKRCDTIGKEKKKRGAWKWKKIDAPGV